ncbi:MAG: ion channel [Pseudomonadota bacterium]
MNQLVLQLILGAGLIVIATAIQAVGVTLLMTYRPHLARKIGQMRAGAMITVMSLGALWMLAWQSLGVWCWAVLLRLVGAFDSLEPALYFAIAAYTTLGFGDVLPPEAWRIMGAMIGANGMIAFGLATAALVAFIEAVRDDLIG